MDINERDKFVGSFFEKLNKIGELKHNQFLMMQEYIKLGEFLGNMLTDIDNKSFKEGYKQGYEDGKKYWVNDFTQN